MKPILIFITCFLNIALWAQNDTLVTVQIICPKKVENNHKLFVTLEINRSNNKGFARFTQKLPPDFVVKMEDQGKAEFELLSDGFRLIWFDMPGNPIFTVSYSVHVPEKYIGNLVMGGLFEYLKEESTTSVEVKPVLVKCGKFQ